MITVLFEDDPLDWSVEPVTHAARIDRFTVGGFQVVAIEVKSARRVGPTAAKGIGVFRNQYPDRFHRGYVLHCGDQVQRLDNDVWALPFSELWTIGGLQPPNEGLQLRDRLALAVDQIVQSRNAGEVQQATGERRRALVYNEALRQLEGTAILLEPILDALRTLDFETQLEPLHPVQNLGAEVVFGGTVGVRFGPASLLVQARVQTFNLERIEWLVSCASSEPYLANRLLEGFETAFGEDPNPQVLDRLNAFADLLPDLVAQLGQAAK